MKDKFEEDSLFIVNCILKEDGDWSEDPLERSMACLAVSLEPPKKYRKHEQLLSFKYVAAAICLREVEGFERLPVGTGQALLEYVSRVELSGVERNLEQRGMRELACGYLVRE